MSPTVSKKFSELVRLFPQRPGEVWDRIRTFVDVHRERHLQREVYAAIPYESAIERLRDKIGCELDSIRQERSLSEVEEHVSAATAGLARDAPFGLFHNGDVALAKFCYLVCRALRCRNVVETGVAYGVTSSFILAALAHEGAGELFSIDLPPLGPNADSFVGCLIPKELCSRWHLYRGQSRHLMRSILNDIGGVDLFIHDSLHTYQNMRWEFQQAWPFLRDGGMLIADDVEQNRAFADFVNDINPPFWMVIKEDVKTGAFGVAMKGMGPPKDSSLQIPTACPN
jgi:hypothetical protein